MRSWGVIALGVVALLAPVAGAQQIEVVGPARVVDGDTLAIGDVRVRLFGIDAPERDQPCRDGAPCGARARAHLEALVADRTVRCREEDVDRYGRLVATCFVGEADINRAMVRAGHAVPYTTFSRRYVDDVRAPVAFVDPWAYRRQGRDGAVEPLSDQTARDEDAGRDCDIKGNISRSSGARIYHRPGTPNYAATRIDPARGERWFCSAAEAEAAGWRAPRR